MKLSRLVLDIVEPPIEVFNAYDGSVIGSVTNVCASQVPQLLETGRSGVRACAALARHRRARILEQAAINIERDAGVFARLVVDEA